jgi:hypothetical protein
MAAPADSFWIIACYFNPGGFRSKRENYDLFVRGLKDAGSPYLVVECACDGARFELPSDDRIIRVRAIDAMWQKERLLNLALARLPRACTKVAWVDCDILFEDREWVRRASEALEALPVIQPFTFAARLKHRGQTSYSSDAEECRGFGSVCAEAPERITAGDFDRHGHTGFAWAARRDWLARHGFYDACMSGNADHLMAHAMCGDWTSGCIDMLLGSAPSAYRGHFERWAARVAADVRGRVGAIPGRVVHLWHGDLAERRYFLRARQFQSFDFDPDRDLRVGADGAWEWSTCRPTIQHWARAFFTLRNEDGAFNFVRDAAPPAREK